MSFIQTTKLLCRTVLLLHIGSALLIGCGRAPLDETSIKPSSSIPASPSSQNKQSASSLSSSPQTTYADVLEVETSGNSGAYQFSVTIQSPDTGCDQYADWWEVISEDGALLHRRILLHSHINEQPFSRSSGPISVSPDQSVIIRAHMHPHGYGGQALQGTVNQGFTMVELTSDFAEDLRQKEPLPTGCNF
ncbi:MAG: hypothetical protein AAGD25_41155 [Cyanobacteria bacterium P01_F01_bin.150]